MMDKNEIFSVESGTKFKANLNGKYKNEWVEETLFFENGFGNHQASPQSVNHVGNNFTRNKFFYVTIFCTIIFILFFSRIIYLQIYQGKELRLEAESNRQRIIPIVAERGLFYDRNGVQLVKNVPNFSLTIIPQNLPRGESEREKIVIRLAQITNQSIDDIRGILNEYKDYSYESVVIKENLDYDKALLIQLEAPDLPGIQIQRGSKRLYLSSFASPMFEINKENGTSTPFSLSQVFGYEGKLNKNDLTLLHVKGYLASDSIGKSGIERTYEEYLRGIYGRRRVEVNSQGREQNVLAEETPEPGKHLVLSIDVRMQAKLEEIMQTALDNNHKTKASGIVMNPSTGDILAMISLPTFDSNDFSGGISRETYAKYINNQDTPLFNRAIAGSFPSGSSIKPAIAAAALQEGIITETTSFLSNGGLRVSSWFFPDWQIGGHGMTNVRKAIASSVNTFFYYIGGGYGNFKGLGVDKLVENLKKFFFSAKLGIDLPGEQAGFLPSREWKLATAGEQWYIGDTYNLSIGQGGLLVTPLQIASMTATFANGGTIYQPHVVGSIIDPITKQEQKINPVILSKGFISDKNIKIVQLGMKDCVTLGSCRRLSLLPFSSAGKTGTAQWNSNKPNHAWFTSFAPFEKPEIVVTIMVEEGGEGSAISAPIAYEFYRWWGTYRNVKIPLSPQREG